MERFDFLVNREALSAKEYAIALDHGKAIDTLEAIQFEHPEAGITNMFNSRS